MALIINHPFGISENGLRRKSVAVLENTETGELVTIEYRRQKGPHRVNVAYMMSDKFRMHTRDQLIEQFDEESVDKAIAECSTEALYR